MAAEGRRLRRADRLRRGSEFRAAGRRGRRVAGESFVVVAAPSARGDGAQQPRIGLTVSRRVGNAVLRNRVKRRIREWFRMHREELPSGLDLVVIARHGAGKLCSGELTACLSRLAAEACGGWRR